MKSRIYSSDGAKAAKEKYTAVKIISKGQTWIPVFFFLGFLISFVIVELLYFGNWFGAVNPMMEEISILYEGLWTESFLYTGFVVIMCGAVINGVQSFWYLYSSRKTDFYHSLPVKRSHLFWQRTGIGILYYLIPYMLMVFLCVCVGAARGFFHLKIIGMALMMCFLHFLLYLLMYFCTVLIICVTGNLLMGALCLGGLMLYGHMLGSLIVACRTIFYDTFYMERYGLLRFLFEYASPFSLGRNLLEQYGGGDYAAIFIAVICVTSAVGMCSYMAFLKRPSESAGRPMVYGLAGITVKFMVVVPCGLGLGLIFYMLPDSGERNVWGIFGIVLGTVLSHGGLEVIYHMNFQKFWSKTHHLVLAGLLIAVCAANYQMDFLKFDDYIPKQENLKAIYMSIDSQIGVNMPIVLKKENGSYSVLGAWTSEEAVLSGEGGVGEKTLQAIKEIVEKQKREKENSSQESINYYRNWGVPAERELPVKYTLKSGREIFRIYKIDGESLCRLLAALYEEGTLKEHQMSFLTMDSKYLTDVKGTFASGEEYSLFQEETKKYEEILDAFSKDMEEASAQELLVQPIAQLSLEYTFPVYENTYTSFSNIVVYPKIFPSFKRTVAILKETGYPISMEKVSLKKVNISYCAGAVSCSDEMEPLTYEDEAELKKLKKALLPSDLTCAWIPKEEEIYVEYYLEGNDQYAYYGTLLSDSMPDFVRKDLEELKGK